MPAQVISRHMPCPDKRSALRSLDKPRLTSLVKRYGLDLASRTARGKLIDALARTEDIDFADIDSVCFELDTALTGHRREIDRLREYRTRLIGDVVTGQLDVREAAANLPDIDGDGPLDEPDDDETNLEDPDIEDDDA